jgi:hypothetical protein
MAALSESWLREADLPTAHELKQGVSVERLGTDEARSYFAVLDKPRSASSPHRRMLFRSTGGAWYCQGKNDGCPAMTDCSHVSAAKAALKRGDVPTAGVLRINSGALAKAAPWLEEWDGVMPQIGVPTAGSESERSGGNDTHADGELLTDEQQYLMGLLMRQPHDSGLACAGSSCFCRKHASLFGEARPPSEGGSKAMEEGDEPSTSGILAELPPRKRARRSKAFWEEENCATSTVHNVRSKRPTPPADAHGKDAIHGWVVACSTCTLSSVAKSGCSHGNGERVECPVMLLGTEAVQLTKPKLGRLSDAANFHDPWVSSLHSPVRVSKLKDCHFAELSDRGWLSAPCPLEAPPCGNTWGERWIEASVTASQRSQRVRVRIYHCTCLDEAHKVHFDGEHLCLYTWNRRTLFVQKSLQLILRGMKKGHSFKAELITN